MKTRAVFCANIEKSIKNGAKAVNLTKKAKVAKVPDIEKDKENEEKNEAEATELEKEQKKL